MAIRASGQGETNKLLSIVHPMSIAAAGDATRNRAKDLILDHLGVALFGSTLPWSSIVRGVVAAEEGLQESTIYGGCLTSARNAALINGTAAHGAELDDTHDESLSHPGAAVIPAALALAEANGASGSTFLTAVLIGYEVMGRIGSAVSDAMQQRGFHPTAQVGVFGATAAAGHILNSDLKTLTSSFGIAASMSSGTQKFTQDAEGTMVKRMHGGLPAERGILAAKLAAKGFTGPRAALEGISGFATIFGGLTNLDRIVAEPSGTLELDRVSIKLYPCCRLFHSLIEAIVDLRASIGDPTQVECVEVYVPSSYIEGHLETRPKSAMAAQYSLPYVAAISILGDPTDPASFSEEAMTRAEILSVVDKVVAHHSPELQKLFPKHLPASVSIQIAGGEKYEKTVIDSQGSPARPASSEEIERKFRTLTSKVLTVAQQDEIVMSVKQLDAMPEVRELTKLLTSNPFRSDTLK